MGVEHLHRIVIFDTETTGHHREYMHHIVNYLRGNHREYEAVLVVHPELAEALPVSPPNDNLQIVRVESDIVANLHDTESLWRRSIEQWKVADAYTRSMDGDHCILMTLNLYQLALGLPSGFNTPYTISGILFSPYVRWKPKAENLIEIARSCMRRMRKQTLLRLMLQNPKVSTIHVLNDPATARYLNRKIDPRKRFTSIPDPVPQLPSPPSATSLCRLYNVDPERTLFLFFGTISERKGIFCLLDALKSITVEVRRRIAVLVLGRVKSGEEEKIRRMVYEVESLRGLQLRTEFRFLEPEELAVALRDCDVVLAPYQRSEGSSGVIGHAARAGKPVIGPNTGLIGKLIGEYNLGTAVDTTVAANLRRAIVQYAGMENRSHGSDRMKDYVRERSPGRFVEQLMCCDEKESSARCIKTHQ